MSQTHILLGAELCPLSAVRVHRKVRALELLNGSCRGPVYDENSDQAEVEPPLWTEDLLTRTAARTYWVHTGAAKVQEQR